MHSAKQKILNVLNRYPEWLCRREFQSQKFRRFNERPIEFSFVFRKIGEIYPQTILDVGTGTTALPHLMRNCGCMVTAIDNVRDYWPSGMLNRHYHVIDDDIVATRLTDTFDMITCISVLEHIQKSADAVRNMISLLKPKGYLVMSFPYSERSYVEDVYQLPGSSYGKGAPYVTQSYSRSQLTQWLENSNARIVEQEYWQFWEGEHWTVGEQLIPPKNVTSDEKHQLTCVLIQKG
jgi:2-polyprenyl-3-methyl-5-hydroxy-6-metoxy-1,4-benzoquinol methylase